MWNNCLIIFHPSRWHYWVFASDMILNIQSNALYLSRWKPRAEHPVIFMDGYLFWTSLSNSMDQFVHCVHSLNLWLLQLQKLDWDPYFCVVTTDTFKELSYLQPPTWIHYDNSTVVGIANDTIKNQQSWLRKMWYFGVSGLVKRKEFDICWHPGAKNLAAYTSKHHLPAHHWLMHPYFLDYKIFPTFLPHTVKPSTLQGCVGSILEIPTGIPNSRPPTSPNGQSTFFMWSIGWSKWLSLCMWKFSQNIAVSS